VTAASGGKVLPGQPVLRDPETVNSPDMSKESQNDLIGTVSRQPELEPQRHHQAALRASLALKADNVA
jgi:hypothetical protein